MFDILTHKGNANEKKTLRFHVTPVKITTIKKTSQAWAAHAYNPSYSGGRGQEDHSSKLAQANSLQDPILKKSP
jgi:hypothetical protein